MSRQLRTPILQNSKIGVIGAGISGLSFTYFLSKLRPDLKFTVFEKSQRSGGYINTDFQDGEKFEKGPRTLRGASDGTLVILDFLLKLGFKEEIFAIYKKSQGNKKYLLSNHKNSEDDYLVQVPDSPETMLKFMLSPLSKNCLKAMIMEPFRKIKKNDEDESIGSFISRRFDKKLNDNIVSAIIHGIYGGDSNVLSMKTLMSSLYKLEKKSSIIISLLKSLYENKDPNKDKDIEISKDLQDYETNFGKPMIPFKNFKKYLLNFPMILFKNKGLSILTDSMYSELLKNENVKFVKEQDDLQITLKDGGEIQVNGENFNHIRSTISSKELSQIVDSSEFANKLKELKFVDMIVVNIFVKDSKLYKEGFGYLVPQSVSPNKNYLLGCIFDSSIEKNSIKLLENNRHLVKLINYPKLKQEDINAMIKLKDQNEDEKTVKLTMMFGGHYCQKHEDIFNQSDRQLKKKVNDLLLEQFNLKTDDIIINRIKDCIPQYEVNYLQYKEDVLQLLLETYGDKLSIGGMSFNSYNGVGVPDCFMDGLKKAIECK